MYALYRCVIAPPVSKTMRQFTTCDRISFNSVTPETFFDKTDRRRNVCDGHARCLLHYRGCFSVRSTNRMRRRQPFLSPCTNHRIFTFSEPSCNATGERSTLLPYRVCHARAGSKVCWPISSSDATPFQTTVRPFGFRVNSKIGCHVFERFTK